MKLPGADLQLKTSDDELACKLAEFDALFPRAGETVERERLYTVARIETKCGYCGNTKIERKEEDRSIRCHLCRKTTWLTAGTFFHKVLNFRAWHLLIWLIEQGVNINSSKFARIAEVASSTSQDMYKKIAVVVAPYMNGEVTAVSSREFIKLFGKRSLVTPANKKPNSEQAEVEKQNAGSFAEYSEINVEQCETDIEQDEIAAEQSDKIIENDKIIAALETPHKEVYEILSESSSLHINVICERTGLPIDEVSYALIMLEVNSLITREKYSERYLRIARSPAKPGPFSESLKSIIEMIIDFIGEEFHRVSRKYIQLYLAMVWCQSAADVWGEGKLIQACMRAGKLSQAEILTYVTPPVVKLWTS